MFRRKSDACIGRKQMIKRQSSQADTKVTLKLLEYQAQTMQARQ